jgi:orotate phosphoribosyltransferase
VIPNEKLLDEAASDLLELLGNSGYAEGSEVEIVVGPQTGATKLAELISQHVPLYTGEKCLWSSPAKNESDGKKTVVFKEEDLKHLTFCCVLLCEDVLTTGGSVDLTIEAVKEAAGIVLPFILVLVNRSGLPEVGGRKIISLIDHTLPMWEPEDCPLCKQGSEAIRPKGENWARLNAEYP